MASNGHSSIYAQFSYGFDHTCLFLNSRCAIPGLLNDTFEIQNDEHQLLVNKFIPDSTDDQHKYDQCNVFSETNSYDVNTSRPINASQYSCNQWVYDNTDFKATFVTKVSLVNLLLLLGF